MQSTEQTIYSIYCVSDMVTSGMTEDSWVLSHVW